MKLVVTHKPCCKRCKVFQCSQWLISRLEYGNSATLIDNIFINNPENNIVSGNIVSDTTDHFSQMCILTSHCKPFFPNNKTKVRDYSTFNAKSFIDDLQNINWNNICKHTDANQSFSRFCRCVNKTINKHAPLRSISNHKQKFLAKSWLTVGLRKSIRVKNNLFYASEWDKYKLYRNKIISKLPQTMNTFFDYLDPPLNRTFFFLLILLFGKILI